MRDEENQRVTLRRLPDGIPHPAFLEGPSRQLLRIDISQVQADLDVKVGDLVEVTTPQYLYLGEVSARRPEVVVVGVEHALDREALAQIQHVWQVPAGS